MTVFVNRQGSIVFTYPDVDIHPGDKVNFDGRIYLVVERVFDVKAGVYEVLLHESAEDMRERKN